MRYTVTQLTYIHIHDRTQLEDHVIKPTMDSYTFAWAAEDVILCSVVKMWMINWCFVYTLSEKDWSNKFIE